MGCGPSTCSHYAIVNDNRSNLLKVTKYPVYGPDAIMNRKRHGTSDVPVQEDLRWNIPRDVADQICNFNLGVAENPGFALSNDGFTQELQAAKRHGTTLEFFDSNTGNLLFEAPLGRSAKAFDKEFRANGWPSFRDEEVNWKYVRCLSNGVLVSVNGTHLGHNLPDKHGKNRYSVNLCSIAGRRMDKSSTHHY